MMVTSLLSSKKCSRIGYWNVRTMFQVEKPAEVFTNNIVRDKTNQEFVSNIVRKRRWKYLGHVLRSDEKRLNRQVLMWSPEGKKNVEDLIHTSKNNPIRKYSDGR
jgi:hypothetical protein